MINKINHFFIILITITLLGCAQFVPPTGGPKDETPPKVTSTYPLQKSKNYKEQYIELEFDELIETSALRQELIITPEPPSSYDLKIKSNSIRLKFSQAFKDSTTYTFNFRNGIKDLNEKNPAQNLKLIFSTGNLIDSLTVTGNVEDAFNVKAPKEALVGLYNLNTTDTLPILKRKPDYFIKTDTTGKYNFENLKSGKYRLLSFTDINSNLIYDEKNESFGFLTDTLTLDTNLIPPTIRLYRSNKSPIKIRRSISRSDTYVITFDRTPKSVEIEYPKKGDNLTYKIDQSELTFFNYPISSDTILTKILVMDSLNTTDTLEQKIYFNNNQSKKPKPEKLIIKSNTNNKQYIKTPHTYLLVFDSPITILHKEKISVVSDSVKIEDTNISWLDKSHTLLQIEIQPTKVNQTILNIEPGSITNYKSDTNQTYTLINTTYQQEDYGLISGKTAEDSTSKIIQLLDAQTFKIVDYQLTTSQFTFTKVIPGNYLLRVILDENKNNQWDPGTFSNNQLPESVIIPKEIIKLKANFEITDLLIN